MSIQDSLRDVKALRQMGQRHALLRLEQLEPLSRALERGAVPQHAARALQQELDVVRSVLGAADAVLSALQALEQVSDRVPRDNPAFSSACAQLKRHLRALIRLLMRAIRHTGWMRQHIVVRPWTRWWDAVRSWRRRRRAKRLLRAQRYLVRFAKRQYNLDPWEHMDFLLKQHTHEVIGVFEAYKAFVQHVIAARTLLMCFTKDNPVIVTCTRVFAAMVRVVVRADVFTAHAEALRRLNRRIEDHWDGVKNAVDFYKINERIRRKQDPKTMLLYPAGQQLLQAVCHALQHQACNPEEMRHITSLFTTMIHQASRGMITKKDIAHRLQELFDRIRALSAEEREKTHHLQQQGALFFAALDEVSTQEQATQFLRSKPDQPTEDSLAFQSLLDDLLD